MSRKVSSLCLVPNSGQSASGQFRHERVGYISVVPPEFCRGTPRSLIGIAAGIASRLGQVISFRNDSFKSLWCDSRERGGWWRNCRLAISP